jgi:hypothetical protein
MANNKKKGKMCCVVGHVDIHKTSCVVGHVDIHKTCCVVGHVDIHKTCCVVGHVDIHKTCCVVGHVDVHKTQGLKSTVWEKCIVTNTDRDLIRPGFFGIKRHRPSVLQNLVQSEKSPSFPRAICNCVCTF